MALSPDLFDRLLTAVFDVKLNAVAVGHWIDELLRSWPKSMMATCFPSTASKHVKILHRMMSIILQPAAVLFCVVVVWCCVSCSRREPSRVSASEIVSCNLIGQGIDLECGLQCKSSNFYLVNCC